MSQGPCCNGGGNGSMVPLVAMTALGIVGIVAVVAVMMIVVAMVVVGGAVGLAVWGFIHHQRREDALARARVELLDTLRWAPEAQRAQVVSAIELPPVPRR